MSIEIVVDLDPKHHDEPTKTIDPDKIAWISGKTYVAGCNITMCDGTKLKSTNEPMDIRARVDEAKANDTEPRRG